ncbi:hypothetical protein WJ77_04230 [Burkholderia ubonensis]|uniref:hypothetical protein n=1 Tax=Burkholderia ubonensis TaxID=101571 RepID=UPI00075475FA|nr:hypothetical protein [Burkholderia ubonensis]KVO63664.1 hypothetical protein WJ77_04230 [Burkholderia ubonensis]
MLSAHEFATLMLVKDAPGRVDPGRAELDVLLERELVKVEDRASAFALPRLTPLGDALLQAMARLF